MDSYDIARLIALSMTAAVAGFVAVYLLVRETPRRDQAVFLASFLALYALFKGNDVMNMTGGYSAAPMLALLTLPVRFLFGATIYFYARSMTSPSPQWLRRSDSLALLWPTAAVVAVIPFILMSAQDKNSLMAEEFTSDEMREWFIQTCKVIFGLFLGSAFIYLAASFRLLVGHVQNLRRVFSNVEDKSLNWLRVILLILALGWSLLVASDLWAIQSTRPQWALVAMSWFDLAWIGAIAFCGLLQRPVFEAESAVAPVVSENARYAKSALDDERMTRIAANLEAAMTEDRLFEDPALSLRSLSDRLGVSDYYVTQTLNEKLGVNFFDFVNASRIAEARRRLEATDASIKEIAETTGFNSRSTFNAAFKKHVGATPSAYRRALKSGGGLLTEARTS